MRELADLGQRLAKQAAMPEGESEEVRRAVEAVTMELARGRLPLEMGAG